MAFPSRLYSVLVVSGSQKFNDALTRLLPESQYVPVAFASSVAAARRRLLERSYDLLLINAPLPDDFGSKLAMDVCGSSSTAVLLLVKREALEETNTRVQDRGVFTLAKPTSPQALLQGLQWMICTRERLRGLEQKAASIDEKMEEIRLVNRAKWLLIECLSMTETEAHRYIEKQAMDRCVTRREIARGIIQTYG
ncbi:MAG: ANTAR domain-containing response regulator [Oscillospiraceae bacterium]